jgi:hypothetical protein
MIANSPHCGSRKTAYAPLVRTDARCARIRPNGARDSIERLGMIYLEAPHAEVPQDGRGAQRCVRLTAQWSRHRSLRSRLGFSPLGGAAHLAPISHTSRYSKVKINWRFCKPS